MASPNMAGIVANLLSVDNGLTFQDIKTFVADTSNTFTSSDCPNKSGNGESRGFKLDCSTMINDYAIPGMLL